MAAAARALARVSSRERVGSMVVQRLHVPGWLGAAPGQFVLLHTECSGRFLPRAFSVMAQQGERVDFLISPVGPGTEELAGARVGEGIWVLGPLGRGFDLAAMLAAEAAPATREPATAVGGDAEEREEPPRLVVVAGGVGLAPFPLLLEELARVPSPAADVLILLGFRDEQQATALDLLFAPLAALRLAGVRVRTEAIAEDGSLGRAGLVTALLAEELRDGDVLAACGSHGMCEAVWQVSSEHGGRVRAWFSLEAAMACGVGSCQGCVMPMADGSLARVCRRGPVFAGEEVFGGGSAPATGAGDQDPEAEGW